MPERLTFSRSLYRPDAIEATAAAYAQLATIAIETEENAIVVTVSDPHPALASELVDAMCNHILFETVRRHRAEQGGEI